MAKLTNEQKIEIYNKRKMGYTLNMLSTEYNINVHGIEYLVRLIDKNGFDVLRKDRNRYYSPKFKEKALRRVFIDGESITAVAIDIGLSSRGILANWIKSYVENGYNIVEKKKMTQSEMQKKIKELELQNLRLRVENEYLKKLDALVMERKKKELKK